MKKNKRVLVTGASGFIGNNLVCELQKRGLECLALDNTPYNKGNCASVQASLLDISAIKAVLIEFRPNIIIHLAAIALVTFENVSEIYRVNVCGTENLLKAAKEVTAGARVILISTAGVYGNQDKQYYDETLPFNPENHYSFSKMITEYISQQYEELDIKIVRPFNIIGVGQRNTFLIPKLVEHFAEKREELRIGNLKATRDYVDVEYCAYILAELATRDDVNYNVYNICSGVGHSVQDIITILGQYSKFYPRVIVDPQFVRKDEVWRLVGNPKRLLEFLNGRKCREFEDTLKQMYNYYSR